MLITVDVSQFLVSETLSGALFSLLLAAWWSILLIQRTFCTRVRPLGRFFAVQGGAKGDLSGNLNAAAPSSLKFDQDALMISSVSEMYAIAVIYIFGKRDSCCVAQKFWLPCHISKMSWTLAILCDFHFPASFFNSKLFSVLVGSNAAQLPANILLLAITHCLTTTYTQHILAVVLDCLQPISSLPREELDSTPRGCGIMGYMSRATFEWSAYFECISTCCHHQGLIYSNRNVL